MKKINSIWYGSKILAAGCMFAIVIPALLYFCHAFLTKSGVVMIFIKISVIIGSIILALFAIMLAVELRQDKNINLNYDKLKYSKIEIADKIYECQHCGSREVKKEDLFCRACSMRFYEQESD